MRAAAAAGAGGSASSSADASSRKRQRAAASALDQLLPSVGGDEDVQLLAEMGPPRRSSQMITNFMWNSSRQPDSDVAWTAACIVDGDSFISASNTSAKAAVIKQFFGGNRSRLAVAKGNKMMLVRNSYRMKHSITNSDKEVEAAFWIEDLAEVDS